MDLMKWVKGQHAGVRYIFEASVRGSLLPAQLLERLGGKGNSIAWLMWHSARSEDVIVNSIIRGEPQVLTQGWQDKAGLDMTHIGTGLSDDEVAEFGKRADPTVIDDYWGAVALQTSTWLASIDPSALDVTPDMDERLKGVPPILAGGGTGAMDFWRGRSSGFLLSSPVISHQYMHVGEMQYIRGALGSSGWF